jgi:hypothetical protein
MAADLSFDHFATLAALFKSSLDLPSLKPKCQVKK